MNKQFLNAIYLYEINIVIYSLNVTNTFILKMRIETYFII